MDVRGGASSRPARGVNGTLWYSARAAGVVAYVLLSGGSVLGMVMASRRPLPWPKFAVEEVHRFVTILTGVFLSIHVGAILLDTYVPFSLGQVLVPFTAS
jgi:sulfoxide reductase heme-binding subunit YedZ